MTRSGDCNDETDRLFAYHQATKHTFQSVRANAHFLDWKNQPNPFRTYDGANCVALPPDPGFPIQGTFATIAGLAEPANPNTENEHANIQLDLTWLSRLLWHSMAISAWKKVPHSGSRYSLRVNPSSGNLHPTETHLALRGFQGLPDGLYHYRADLHALELRSSGAWIPRLAEALKIPESANSTLIVGLTSIFWREAWKYRDRAYRYCCHDMGHALMSILIAARALGVRGRVVAHFCDAALTDVLGLAGADEMPMAFLVFPSEGNENSAAEAVLATEPFSGIPNELSADEVPYPLIRDIHSATTLGESAAPLRMVLPSAPQEELASESEPLSRTVVGEADTPLATVSRRRRSALDFDPQTEPMERHQIERMLTFATKDWPADWRGNSPGQSRIADLISPYVYVHRVRDCEPGVYLWDHPHQSLQELHRGNVQRIAAFLSLEQELAGNSCFTISMIADLERAAKLFGNRGYRFAFFEAGAIGQRLYLGAEVLNWNATGIGAFYDDDVHRYLGFLEESQGDFRERAVANPESKMLPRQVVYHFAVGRAVSDPRREA
jgi:SagB-type dehydrogenase family enzyme